jgi:hypothetical protein
LFHVFQSLIDPIRHHGQVRASKPGCRGIDISNLTRAISPP